MPRKISMTDEQMIEDLRYSFGVEFTAGDVRGYCASRGLSYPTVTRRLEPFKTDRGRWNLEVTQERVEEIERSYQAPAATVIESLESVEKNLIPLKNDTFVPFGNFPDLKKIIQSKMFYPVFITGLSGNGKTFGVEQACAQLGRELIRINFTNETDESDLIGGFRLKANSDGATETVWQDGPVIEALERGAILLCDEIDVADANKILVLQSVMEGNGIFLKKVGRYVKPAPGFNVIATANTKGKGSDDGRFIGTNVLNSAFLDRFAITLEQEYPATAVETKILKGVAKSIGLENSDDFIKQLCDWTYVIRETFYEGGVDEIISTRRLVHILKAYSIFGDKSKSIKYSISGFDDETKQGFLEVYDKIDADFQMTSDDKSNTVDEPLPF
jgi:hypothetical protein